MPLNTFDDVDQAVIDDCFCRYTGEEIKALIRERNQAMAERDEAINALKTLVYLKRLKERYSDDINCRASKPKAWEDAIRVIEKQTDDR